MADYRKSTAYRNDSTYPGGGGPVTPTVAGKSSTGITVTRSATGIRTSRSSTGVTVPRSSIGRG